MANIPAYTGKTVKGALGTKGFTSGKGDHHHLFLMVDGKRTPIRTKISHGRKTYRDGLWKCLKEQLKLDNQQLNGLIGCTLSYEEYIEVLREKQILS